MAAAPQADKSAHGAGSSSEAEQSMAYRLVTNKYFEPFIACVITFNCFELAWDSPLDPPGTWKADFIAGSEQPLLYIFTFEMLAKMTAYGIIRDRHSYLRDPWSCLDFVVVTMAWAPYVFPDMGNFTGIRAVRALRPLRTLQYVPGMPLLVSAIIQACSQLGSVMAILGFTMLIFGILGQGVFQGSLHFHCATPDEYKLYLKGLEEHDEGHRRRAFDFRTAGNVQTPRFWAEDSGREAYEPGLAMSEAGADVENTGEGVSKASGQVTAETWYELPQDTEDEPRADSQNGGLGEMEAETEGRMSNPPGLVSGRALKGGGSTGSTSRIYVARSPPPPPPPLGTPVVIAPVTVGPTVAEIASIICGDVMQYTHHGYVEKCCPELLAGHRQRNLRERRQPGRALKGGGGGGGGGGPSDPCNPTFSAADGPFCDPGNANSCPIGADCLFFPEAVTLNDFDSVMNAGMIISQIVTLDTWSGSMYDVMAAYPAPTVVWIYYLLAVLIGGFFIINLFLGVVFDEFMRAKATEAAKQELAEKENAFNEEMMAEAADEEQQYAKRGGTGDDSPSSVQDGQFHPLVDNDIQPESHSGGIQCLKPIVASESFIAITLLFLCINVVLMCLPYAGQPESRTEALKSLSTIFTNLFIAEIVIRLLAMGPAEFFSDGWNVMDVFLVGVSGLEVGIMYLETNAHLFNFEGDFVLNVTVFRALRLLRVMRLFRLVQYWAGVYKIFYSLIAATPQIANIFVLLFVFMTVFSLLGMQIFGGHCGSEEGSRYHFDYYMPAMLVVLIVFSGGWVDAYESCLPAGVEVTRVYFGVALLIGFFIIMNLFVAILLDSLAEAEEECEDAVAEETEDEKAEEPNEEPILIPVEEQIHPVRAFCRSVINHKNTDVALLVAIGLSSATLAIDSPFVDPNSALAAELAAANILFTALFTCEAAFRLLAYDPLHPTKGYFNTAFNLLDFAIVVVSLISLCPEMQQYSLFRILRVLRPLRLLSRVPGMSVIFIFIIEASGDVFNVVGVVFFCHALFAVVGMELFSGSFGACTDPSITLKELCFDPTLTPAMAAATPVAVPHRNLLDFDVGGSAELQEHLMFTPPPMTSTPLPPRPETPSADPVVSLEELETFMTDEKDDHLSESAAQRRRTRRRMNAKSVPDGITEEFVSDREPRYLFKSRHGRLLKGGGGGGSSADTPIAWLNPAWGSFDDFWSSVLLLFVAATADGWDMFMFTSMDAVGPNVAPVRNDFSPVSLFFILWLVLGCFTMMNLFVGSVCDNFSRIKSEQDGSATMTEAQKQWVRTMQEGRMFKERIRVEKAPDPPSNSVQRSFFMLVNSDGFDGIMTLVILLNVCLMSVDFYKMEEDAHFYDIYSICNLIFLNIYYVECVFKLSGLGVSAYFTSPWNQFDFFLVVVSLVDQFATELLAEYLPIPPMLLRTIRVARIMRILRLLKRFKRLRDLIKTTILSFPSLINVGALLGLVTFIYAVLGVQLFCFVRPGDELNEQRNFRTFGSACLLLVQCLTGDGWSTLMADASQGPERGCDPNLVPSDCGNRNQSLIYFLTYMFIGTFVLLNLVVAVILENFSALGNVNPDLVSAADITDFGELWSQSWTERAATQEQLPTPRRASRRDARSMMAMEEDQLAKIVLLQPPPLGLQGKTDLTGAQSFISSLRLPKDDHGFVQFQDVIDALVKISFEGHPEFLEVPEMPPDEEKDPFDDSQPPASSSRKSPSPTPQPVPQLPPKPPPQPPPQPLQPPPPPPPPQPPQPQQPVAIKAPKVKRPEAVPPLPMAMPYYAESEARHPVAAPLARSAPAPAPAASPRRPSPAAPLPTRQDAMPEHMYAQPQRPSSSSPAARQRVRPQQPEYVMPNYTLLEPRRIAVPPPSSVILERPRTVRPSGSPPDVNYLNRQRATNQRSPTAHQRSPDAGANPFMIFSAQLTGGSATSYGGDPRSLPAPARLPPPLGSPPAPQGQPNGSNAWP